MKKTFIISMLVASAGVFGMIPNVASNRSNSIMTAVERRDINAVKRLIGSFYDNNTIIDLMSAYANKRSWSKADLQQYLDPILKKIRDTINVRNKKGDTPLITAIRNENESLAKYLVERGAHIHVPNCFGRTAQTVAEDSEYNAIIEILQNAEEE